MSTEFAKNSFLQSILNVVQTDETSIGSQFLNLINQQKLEVIPSDLVFDLRLQTCSLNGKTYIFIPNNFSPKWGGKNQSRTVWNLMVDTAISLRGQTALEVCKLKR